MTATIIPHGRLAGGNYGVLLDSTTGDSLASVIEVLSTLPSIASTDNFSGRMVFSQSDYVLYIYVPLPTAYWKPLENVDTIVGNVAGVPPTITPLAIGQMYWDLDTESLFVWNGIIWQATTGQTATQLFENTYTGDGATTTFASGAATPVSDEYQEIFLDGVRQVGSVDYITIGTNISFVTAPALGVQIHSRVMVSDNIVQTAQVAGVAYTATASQTVFDTGIASSDPAGVFVYKDGILQSIPTNYTLTQQDVSIVSLTRVTTTATVVTTAAHGMSIGSQVTLINFAETQYNKLLVTLTGVPTVASFEFTVLVSDPAAGTPVGTAYYTPSFINDIVTFVTPLVGGEIVDIRTLRGVVIPNAAGEVNTLLSTGTGLGLNNTKVGSALNVKSLIAGANIILTDNGNDITVASSAGGGFEDRSGSNSTNITVADPTSYVGVQNTTTSTTVNISGIAAGGRRIIIKDEAGVAGTFPLNTSTGGGTIDGAASPYVISTNYGSVSLVSDGTNWFITSATP
jgi:hypothetical protein